MGTQWWRYVGLSTRVGGSTIIFGEDFTPQNYLLLSRLAPTVKQIFLTGKVGIKIYLVKNNLTQLGDIVIGTA